MTLWPASCAPPLTLRSVVRDGVVTVLIRGELDLSTTPVLSRCLEQILEDKPRLLVFDVAGVAFIDCAAVRMIIETGHALPGSPAPVLRRPSPVMRRMLSLTGLDARCVIEP